MEAFKKCCIKNKNLGRYDLKYNNIQDKGVEFITGFLPEANHVVEIEVSERISKETMEAFRATIALNKPKKGKKKGKKKKKK